MGDAEGAEAAFRESITLHTGLSHLSAASCLVGLAHLAEVRGLSEQAARLWGAAEGLGAGSRPDLSECRPDDAPRVAAARTRLSAPDLAAPWAAGASLTAAQAAAFALGEP